MNKNINLLKNILFFGALVLLLELCLKLFAPVYFTGPFNAYEYNEDLGVAVKKNLNLVKITDHRQEYITNKLGTFNFEDDFSNYDRIIFAIGDSVTQGTGVSPTSSYPFKLFINLNTDKEIENISFGVVNLGLSAFGFEQSFITTKIFLEKLKPNYIVYLGVGNDVRDDHLFLSGYRHNHLVEGSPRFFGMGYTIGILANNIEILKRIKLILSQIRLKNTFKSTEIDYDKTNTNFKKYLRLKKLADTNNIKLFISWYQCNGVEATNYKKLQEWSIDNDINFIDWCKDFKKIKSKLSKLPIANSHSSGHYRPWVYTIISDNIANKIKENELQSN